MSEHNDLPLHEQTVCRHIVNGARCGGDMVRTGMTQEQTIDFRPNPHGRWFYDTRCDRCGRTFALPVPDADLPWTSAEVSR